VEMERIATDGWWKFDGIRISEVRMKRPGG
jgi:hypothetical protein